MTITIDLDKEKSALSDLVEQTLVGVEVVLTKGDRPVARLVPIRSRPPRRFGSAKGLIEVGDGFDEPLEDFRDLVR
jgi:antitoxin (DNA-binding transcriptional repressor) of toxin-antitoxin stability system